MRAAKRWETCNYSRPKVCSSQPVAPVHVATVRPHQLFIKGELPLLFPRIAYYLVDYLLILTIGYFLLPQPSHFSTLKVADQNRDSP